MKALSTRRPWAWLIVRPAHQSSGGHPHMQRGPDKDDREQDVGHTASERLPEWLDPRQAAVKGWLAVGRAMSASTFLNQPERVDGRNVEFTPSVLARARKCAPRG